MTPVRAPGTGPSRWVLFGAWAVFLSLPLVATLLYSLATVWRDTAFPDGYTLRWWRTTLSDDRLLDALRRSLLLGVLAVVLIAAITLPALYWAHVHNPRIRPLLQAAALLPFALPFVVLAYGFKNLAGLTDATADYEASSALLLLGHVALAFPFFLWPVDAAMSAAGVRRLHEAAAASGAGPATTLRRVVLPAVRGGVLTGAVLAFAVSFGEYSIARVITGNSFETLPVWQVAQLRDSRGNPNGVAVMALVTFAVLFVGSLLLAWRSGGRGTSALPGLAGAGAGAAAAAGSGGGLDADGGGRS